jgi:hypothetical protein
MAVPKAQAFEAVAGSRPRRQNPILELPTPRLDA